MTNRLASLTLYARREPTSDHDYLRTHGVSPKIIERKTDVVIYRDKDATDRVGVYSWHNPRRPTRRNKTIMHNCFRYNLVWLPPLKG